MNPSNSLNNFETRGRAIRMGDGKLIQNLRGIQIKILLRQSVVLFLTIILAWILVGWNRLRAKIIKVRCGCFSNVD